MRASRRGRLIVLVGPDGVGKSTVARALMERWDGPAAYFHFLPPLWGALCETPDPGSVRPPPAAAAWPVPGSLRLLRNAVRCWLSYLASVRPALRRGCLVVGDRWLYGYLASPAVLKFRGPHRLARAVVRMMPRPDRIVNLSAPPHVIHARKQELTPAQIEQQLLAWASLPLSNVHTVDACRPPDAIAEEILRP